jgi:hypothetical protein
VTYVPVAYDPRQLPAAVSATPGQFGLVHPNRGTGRGVWVVLVLIIATVAGFVGWRVVHTAAAPQPGIAYTSTAGHFAARFPAQPVELTRSVRSGRSRLIVHLAVVAGQGSVAEMQVVGAAGGDLSRLGEHLAASFGSTDEITLTGVRNFTFEGMRARQGNYLQPVSGQLATMLIAAQSSRRAYLVLGLTGPTFDALKASFRTLP